LEIQTAWWKDEVEQTCTGFSVALSYKPKHDNANKSDQDQSRTLVCLRHLIFEANAKETTKVEKVALMMW